VFHLLHSFYTAQTVGYGDVRIKYDSTKIFLIFYALLAPIVLAFTFDAIINLRGRVTRRRYARDVLSDKIPLSEVIVDFDALQQAAHAEQRLLEEPLLVRVRRAGSRKLQIGLGEEIDADLSSEQRTLAETSAPSATQGTPPRQEPEGFIAGADRTPGTPSAGAQLQLLVRTPLRGKEEKEDEGRRSCQRRRGGHGDEDAPLWDEEGGWFARRYDDEDCGKLTPLSGRSRGALSGERSPRKDDADLSPPSQGKTRALQRIPSISCTTTPHAVHDASFSKSGYE
jgi:hypothetical protein